MGEGQLLWLLMAGDTNSHNFLQNGQKKISIHIFKNLRILYLHWKNQFYLAFDQDHNNSQDDPQGHHRRCFAAESFELAWTPCSPLQHPLQKLLPIWTTDNCSNAYIGNFQHLQSNIFDKICWSWRLYILCVARTFFCTLISYINSFSSSNSTTEVTRISGFK